MSVLCQIQIILQDLFLFFELRFFIHHLSLPSCRKFFAYLVWPHSYIADFDLFIDFSYLRLDLGNFRAILQKHYSIQSNDLSGMRFTIFKFK